MRTSVLALASALILAATPFGDAKAQRDPLVTVVGVGLGSPLTLPECPRRLLDGRPWPEGDPESAPLYISASVTCFQLRKRKYNVSTGMAEVELEFASGQWPLLPGVYRLTVLDGRVERMEIDTIGIEQQKKHFDLLVEKFGRPDSIKSPVVQNRMGAKFETIDAIWLKPGYGVGFRSAAGAINRGVIRIQTDVAEDYFKKQNEREKSQRRPL